MRNLFTLLCFLCAYLCNAETYQTEIFGKNYRTLQVGIEGLDFSLPVITLNSEDRILISFDEMSRNPQDLAYSIIYCNADWTKSELDKIEYMEGFDGIDITDYEYARNTTFDYTHYEITLPNEDIKLTLSGNYAVKIYDKAEPDKTLLCATFSINEDIVPIEANVSSNTSRGVNTKFQQLNMSILFSQSGIAPTSEEITTIVRQNNRRDNEVKITKPSFIKATDFIYSDNPELIFEGGNEYQKIDFSHRVNYSGMIDQIRFYRPYYHVTTRPCSLPETKEYNHSFDENGKYKVWEQDKNSMLDIDYSIVHFSYKTEDPWLDGDLYVQGDFNYGRLDNNNKMIYNFEDKEYRADLVLKNGGYNYQYIFKRAGDTAGKTDRVSYSHWQTENEYTIYIYYRRFGGLYDRLLSVITIHN